MNWNQWTNTTLETGGQILDRVWWINTVAELVDKYLIESWWTNIVVELLDKYLIESRRQLCGLSPTMRAITPLVRIN